MWACEYLCGLDRFRPETDHRLVNSGNLDNVRNTCQEHRQTQQKEPVIWIQMVLPPAGARVFLRGLGKGKGLQERVLLLFYFCNLRLILASYFTYLPLNLKNLSQYRLFAYMAPKYKDSISTLYVVYK